MPVDNDALRSEIRLVSNKADKKLNLLGAVAEPPPLTWTIDGASTLDLVIADYDRELTRSPHLDERSWANVAGIHFELVGVSKAGDRVTLKFEDAIAAALRRRTKPLSAPAGSTTRKEFTERLAREAGVPCRVDPTPRGRVQNPLHRSADGQKTDSWEFLGSEIAEPIHWRRFSNGSRLMVGSDEWLMSLRQPITIRENRDGVGSIDFDLDGAKRASTAKAIVDIGPLKRFTPGAPVNVVGVGPADGKWLVSEVRRTLTSSRGELTLTRKRHVLKEPKREGAGDPGEDGYGPGKDGEDGGGKAGNAARERMVQFALAQRGKPYVWGASGPDAYDCSGLVQAATRAGGRQLTKPSSSQWNTCVAQGKTIAVSTALGIRGALLFRVGGEFNHVAISLGNGTTMEAMGTAYGCLVAGNAGSRGWTGAALWL